MAAKDAFRVLIAGGGVAALEATLALRALAEERVQIQLIAPETEFWYRPLAVLEPFGLGRVHALELADLAHACGVGFDLASLAEVDPGAGRARTAAGAEYEYDALVIACGALPREALPGAFTFRGPADTDAYRRLVDELASDGPSQLVFAVPGGTGWALPLYELALLTAQFFDNRGAQEIEVALVTHEAVPLALLGPEASGAVGELLAKRRISVHTGRYAVAINGARLHFAPHGSIAADRVVAMPRLEGPAISGLPHDRDGFIPTDMSGRVVGVGDVYAAGDATAFPVKQGGLAAQQADAVAEAIAAWAGAPVAPQPFRPIIRGLLLTGGAPTFVRAEIAGGAGAPSVAATEPLWWPPSKIVGRYLAPFLAEHAGAILSPPTDLGALRVERELEPV